MENVDPAPAPNDGLPGNGGADGPNAPQMELPIFTLPTAGESIICDGTGATYRIGPLIGEGGFAYVYGCEDDWGNRLAVKILKPLDRLYEDVRVAAETELIRLRHLRHPNITYVHDAFQYRHTFYVVMERCDRTVAHMMQVANFSGAVWIRALARCLLQAVQFLHNSGIAHQDIHAGNVFLTFVRDELLPDNSATTFKLADLGIAKLVNEMNAENTVLAEWMRAPEAIQVQEFGPMDHRMDLYHCGLLFLSFLRGAPLTYTREQVLDGQPRRDALTLPAPYNFAIEKALRRHVSHRTQSAREFWRDFTSPLQ